MQWRDERRNGIKCSSASRLGRDASENLDDVMHLLVMDFQNCKVLVVSFIARFLNTSDCKIEKKSIPHGPSKRADADALFSHRFPMHFCATKPKYVHPNVT